MISYIENIEGISTINMISYIENHEESTKNLLKLANEFLFPFPSVFKLNIEYFFWW